MEKRIPNPFVATAGRCIQPGRAGHRADIVSLKAIGALAAWHGRIGVNDEEAETALGLTLPYRMRRLPVAEIGRLP